MGSDDPQHLWFAMSRGQRIALGVAWAVSYVLPVALFLGTNAGPGLTPAFVGTILGNALLIPLGFFVAASIGAGFTLFLSSSVKRLGAIRFAVLLTLGLAAAIAMFGVFVQVGLLAG